jgi:hypothetical protein
MSPEGQGYNKKILEVMHKSLNVAGTTKQIVIPCWDLNPSEKSKVGYRGISKKIGHYDFTRISLDKREYNDFFRGRSYHFLPFRTAGIVLYGPDISLNPFVVDIQAY